MFDSNEKEEGLFDLDFQSSPVDGSLDPLITSHSLCTPGCGKNGSYNSFCC